MSDGTTNFLGYAVALLVMIAPYLLKWLARRQGKNEAQTTAPPPVAPLPGPLEEQPEIDFGEPPVSSTELGQALARARALHDRAIDLGDRIRARGGLAMKLLATIETALVPKARKAVFELERLQALGALPSYGELAELEHRHAQLTPLADLLEEVAELRIRPAHAATLSALDLVAEDCLVPFVTHAKRQGLVYQTRSAMVFPGAPRTATAQLLARADIAAIAVSHFAAERPGAWAEIPVAVARDVFYSTRGLAREIDAALAVAPPDALLSPRASERALIAIYVSRALPEIFAQAAAALELGPAFCAAVACSLDDERRRDEALFADPQEGDELPLHLKMYIGCRVLAHLGFADEAKTRFEKWCQRLDWPSAIEVVLADGSRRFLEISSLLGTVARAVDAIVAMPLNALGLGRLAALPGLACGAREIEEMERVASQLVNGQMVSASPRAMLAGACLAEERATVFRSRTARLCLQALAHPTAQAIADERGVARSSQVLTVRAILGNPSLAARAMALGAAVSPRGTFRGAWSENKGAFARRARRSA